ncbi:glycine--tRNA ligase subunit beta [bacterium]|nr:MAG: glycine--tRNA ligase subunit beta [bacterium]
MKTGELIFEIGTEEIPAGFVPLALDALEALARQNLGAARVPFDEIHVYGTPRRMTLHITGMGLEQPDIVEELMGPSITVAFDAAGNLTKAGEGFARSKGATPADLLRVKTDKGEYIAVKKTLKGRETSALLRDELPRWMSKIPFRKSMRWGSGETAFARPIHWILALLDGDVIDFEYAGVKSGRSVMGHRFHSTGTFEVMDAQDYFRKLRDAGVVLAQEERKAIIAKEVAKAAQKVGGQVLLDPELLDTITFLVEKPVAVTGSFEPHYLELPRELLILSMKTHQKYFAVTDAEGSLLNHFVTVSNTAARDLSVVAKGNERVLRARLSDASFFFVEDQKISLAEHAEELKRVVFQLKLGTSWEKVERFTAIAGELSKKLCPSSAEKVRRIAHLCKADLCTKMVYEFPELQGIVGRQYALRAGEDPLVAKAIHEHYLPVQAGSALPSTPEADCVSIGDKIDTIAGCFGVGLIPSGSADPYALRRQTIGILRIMMEKGYRLSIEWLVDLALDRLSAKLTRKCEEVKKDVLEFFKGRLEVILTEAGYAGDAVAAVLDAGFDDPLDVKARVEAIEEFKKRGEFAALAGTFKRAANILKKIEAKAEVNPALFQDKAEGELWDAYNAVHANMDACVASHDYIGLFTQAAKLKGAVDGFFDGVMVMAEDEALKNNRVAILGKVTAIFGRVADFTRITGA